MKYDNKKTIIFDMDGTLYKFKGGSFRNSGLYDVVIRNTLIYISNKLKKTKSESQEILNSVLEKYGDSISIGLEKEFEVNRHDYFNSVWNIDEEKYVELDPIISPLLTELQKNFNLVLLSDAPMIWINKVLDHIGIREIFKDNIFSGEDDVRKEFGNAFEEAVKVMDVKVSDCVVVGDQEETDIIPAKKMGMKTIFVGNDKNSVADYTIRNIYELKNLFNKL